MTRLTQALEALRVDGEIALAGRWITIHGERSLVYVVEAAWSAGYYSWCAAPQERAVECYRGPIEAIRAGLRRAARDRQDAHEEGEVS